MVSTDTAGYPRADVPVLSQPAHAAVTRGRWACRTPLFLLCSALLLYSVTPTADFYGDGITYAFNIEHVFRTGRSFPRLIHQNHLLYSVAGYCAYSLAARWTSTIRAIEVLQFANTVFGALGVVAFYFVARSYLRTLKSSLACATSLAVLAGWWRTSTDADAYIVGAAIVLCSAAIASRGSRWWPVAALVMTLAMLVHQIAALSIFGVACVVYSASDGSQLNRTIRAAGFCVLSGALAVVTYAVVALATQRVAGVSGLVSWALSNQGGFELVIDPVGNLGPALLSNIQLVLGYNLSLFATTAGVVDYVILGLAVMGLVTCVLAVLRYRAYFLHFDWHRVPTGMLPVALIWILPYAVFLLVWEPYLTYYRVFYAPAAVLLVGAVFKASAASTGAPARIVVWSLIASLMLANVSLYIRPNMDIRANPLIYQAKTKLADCEGVILLMAPNQADMAAVYFNPQLRPRFVRNGGESLLDQCTSLLEAGNRVWLNADAAAAAPDQLRQRLDDEGITIASQRHSTRFVEVLSRARSLAD